MYSCDKLFILYILNWNEYSIIINYKRRIKCSKEELLRQLERVWPNINKLSAQLAAAREQKDSEVSQKSMWKKFVLTNLIGCRHLCKLLIVMFSIPVNTGWIERAYSTVEMICLLSEETSRRLCKNFSI